MAEAKELAERWRRLEAGSRTVKPGRLPQPETALQRLLRGLVDLGRQTIEIADRALEMERLRAASATLPPFELVRLDPDEPAFAQTEVDVDLEVALAQEVPLAGGGRLLIEPTAAFVAIDVDGGGRAPLDIDLAAAAEIARQTGCAIWAGPSSSISSTCPAGRSGSGSRRRCARRSSTIPRRWRSTRCPRSASCH